jgi:hypothetical protein
LIGIPIGLFLAAIGISVPLLRRAPEAPEPEEVGGVDPAILGSELARLRDQLGANAKAPRQS